MGSRYLLNKIVQAIGTIFFIVILNFVLFRMMPGSPDRVLLRNPNVTDRVPRPRRASAGASTTRVPIQLVKYIGATLQGDLGYSFQYQGLPVTEVLVRPAVADADPVRARRADRDRGRPRAGAYSGWKRGGPVDYLGNGASLVLYSMPYFVIGMFMLGIFATGLGWFPTNGMFEVGKQYETIWQQLGDFARHLFLPVMTVAIGLIGQYSILMRSSVIDTLGEDYVTTARAKGMRTTGAPDHALPNAMLPAVTLIAINLGFVIGAPSPSRSCSTGRASGTLTVDAVSARDYPVLQGIFLLLSISVVVANLVADIVYGRLDPRVRA